MLKRIKPPGIITATLPILIVLLLAIVAVLTTSPPKPKGLDAPANEFSANRAFKHIKEVFSKPHMSGTLEHERVCSYIVNELERLGLEVDVQTTTAMSHRGSSIFANVTNVMGRIKGGGNGKAIMVMGHYDTQPHTPGAADDGIAVGSMLEAASVIKKYYSLENDIIFLFTDAEEVGLLGASAFANEHPWIDDVGLILNLEARGNAGAGYAFEISSENGWIVREMAKGMKKAFAGSMMYEVYKMMPNDTDFTVFRNQGFSGINVALVEGLVNYHSPTDTPENLSLASLQHMGSYIMDFANHFGNISLLNTKENDMVYFNLFGGNLILFPASWNFWLLGIALVLFIIFLMLANLRRRISFWYIFLSFFGLFLSLGLTLGSVWILNSIINALYPHYSVFYFNSFYNVSWYFLAYMALTVTVFYSIQKFLLVKLNIYNVFTSIQFVFLLATIYIIKALPTASYLTLVPVLLSLLPAIIILFFDIDREEKSFRYHLIYLIALLPVIFLLAPYAFVVFHNFGLGTPILGGLLLCLLLLFTLPLVEVSVVRLRQYLPLIALLLTISFFVVAHIQSSPSENRPLQSNIMYASLNEQGQAFWLSSNLRTDEWNGQFFENARVDSITEFYPKRGKQFLKSDAEFMEFDKPEIDVSNQILSDSISSVEFKLKSMIDPVIVELLIPSQFNVSSVSVNGKQAVIANTQLSQQRGYHLVRLIAPSPLGDRFVIDYQSAEPFHLTILEKKLGIPQFEFVSPMPVHIIPDTDYESYMTLVANHYFVE